MPQTALTFTLYEEVLLWIRNNWFTSKKKYCNHENTWIDSIYSFDVLQYNRYIPKKQLWFTNILWNWLDSFIWKHLGKIRNFISYFPVILRCFLPLKTPPYAVAVERVMKLYRFIETIYIYTIVNYTLVRPKLDYCFAGWHPVPLMYKKPWKRFKLGSYDPCTSKIITQIITLFDLVSAERFLFLFVNNQIIEKKWENSSNDFYRFIEEILLFHSFYI